jgi:5-methyltetrahydrofolate--homocysteine methyltransferase
MRAPLLETIRRRVVVANGAMGSMLAAKGLRLANSATANADHGDVVREIFAEYRDAGAELFQSNTFAASSVMLRHIGRESEHDELNRLGIRLVRDVVGDDAYIAANLGPTGELLAPLGPMPPEAARESFRRQAKVLLAERPDLLLLESFEALEELEAAMAGVREAGCDVPVAITFSFSQPSGRSMMGVSPTQALATMLELGADIVGANCGLPDTTLAAVKEMAPLTDRPLMMQANAGVPEIRGGETRFTGTPEDSANLAREAAAAGARLIGGCCGTTPAHVAAIARALRQA